MSRAPRIGITGPDRGGWPAWIFTRRAIRRAGGRPIRVTPSRIDAIDVDALDALVLGGGADVGPHGESAEPAVAPAHPRFRARDLLGYLVAPLVLTLRRLLRLRRGSGVDPRRDELELGLLALAERRRLPVLGICRGAQLMNVHRGGSLHRSLASFYTETTAPWTVLPAVTVEVTPGSALESALGRDRVAVNSLHRHAIHELGSALSATALDGAGIVQAIERVDGLPWIGVQWHPEYLPQRPEQQRLFQSLTGAATAAA